MMTWTCDSEKKNFVGRRDFVVVSVRSVPSDLTQILVRRVAEFSSYRVFELRCFKMGSV